MKEREREREREGGYRVSASQQTFCQGRTRRTLASRFLRICGSRTPPTRLPLLLLEVESGLLRLIRGRSPSAPSSSSRTAPSSEALQCEARDDAGGVVDHRAEVDDGRASSAVFGRWRLTRRGRTVLTSTPLAVSPNSPAAAALSTGEARPAPPPSGDEPSSSPPLAVSGVDESPEAVGEPPGVPRLALSGLRAGRAGKVDEVELSEADRPSSEMLVSVLSDGRPSLDGTGGGTSSLSSSSSLPRRSGGERRGSSGEGAVVVIGGGAGRRPEARANEALIGRTGDDFARFVGGGTLAVW